MIVTAYLLYFAATALPAYSQQKPPDQPPSMAAQQPAKPGGMGVTDEEEIAHPFFTHMGVPEGVGVYSLRLAGLATRVDGRTDGDVGFHFETGLTKFIGLHIRNDGILTNTRTEAMFQFAAVRSQDGMSGVSPLIEFEIPTRSGDGSRIHTLVGFSTALTRSRIAFNQVVHYNPREDMVDGSAALVFKVGTRFYPVMEVLAETMRHETPVVSVLVGLKMRVSKNVLLGFAYDFATSTRKDFSSRLVFQPDLGWRRARP